jgi:hypothetical protein
LLKYSVSPDLIMVDDTSAAEPKAPLPKQGISIPKAILRPQSAKHAAKARGINPKAILHPQSAKHAAAEAYVDN